MLVYTRIIMFADVISDILSNGPSSRLHQRLVKKQKTFVEIDAYITASDDIGLFVIEGKVTENYAVEDAINLYGLRLTC